MRSRTPWATLVRVSVGVLALSAVATAQLAPIDAHRPTKHTADAIAARGDSIAAAGDTAAAMAYLESVLYPHSTNAAAWHRYGIIQWQRAASRRGGGYIADRSTIAALRLADSALRLATRFAPDSAEYWTTLGRFNLQSDVGSMRFAATQQMELAFHAASRVGDSSFIAQTADESGLAIMRRYETTVNRAMVTDAKHVQLQTSMRWQRGRAVDFLATFANKIEPPTGKTDYLLALERFRMAEAVEPSNLRYSRHLLMVLAEGRRWEELLAVANVRAARSPFDAQARFARGLALQRIGRGREASASFDSASALLDDVERDRLFRLDPLLPPAANVLTGKRGLDTSTVSHMSSAQRTAVAALYWAVHDPVIATAEGELRVEFIARVVQAELRWTDDELGLHGADTDRGDIFVRYGPPDNEMTISGTASVQQDVSESHATVGGANIMSTSQVGGTTLAWLYKSGDVFFFDMANGFGTARTPITDQQFVKDVATLIPATWDNLDLPRWVDSLTVRTTRFRATTDSADVVIATGIPLVALSKGVDLRGADVAVDLRLFDGLARTIGAETSRAPLDTAVVRDPVRSWVRRVGDGVNIVRVEALQRESGRAARALHSIEPLSNAGVGMSDILLTSVGATAPPRAVHSWRDLGATPSNGLYLANEKIGVAWEMYDLAARADSAAPANAYRVSLSVERVARGAASAFAIRVIDRMGAVLRQGRSTADHVNVSFERTVAAATTQVEFFSLDWIEAARGEYQLRVDVTDLVSGRTSSRLTRLRIQ